MRKWKDETYMETTREKIPFINTEIVKLPHQSTYIRLMVFTTMGFIRISTKSLKEPKRKIYMNYSNL